MDQYSSDTGNLNVIVTGTDSYSPLSSATIEIANTGEPNRILESITTDQNGQTGYIELSAPPREYSMEPTDNQPYSEYNVKISAPGYQKGLVSGVQIFSGENGLQSIVLQPSEQTPTMSITQSSSADTRSGNTIHRKSPSRRSSL